MKIFARTLLSLFLAAAALTLNAAVTDLPIRTINGHQYYYYVVKPNETLLSLPHRLGVDKETIVKYNPAVIDGVEAHQTLYFPVESMRTHSGTNTSDHPITGSAATTHTVKKGETVYGICNRYGITTEKLYELNPSLCDGLKAGQTLVISTATENVKTTDGADDVATPQPTVVGSPLHPEATHPDSTLPPREGFIVYEVSRGESLYGIAKAHATTVDAILAANPHLNPTYYREGDAIYIPTSAQRAAVPDGSTVVATIDTPKETVTDTIPALPAEDMATPQSQATTIAVMLPFMLNEKTMSRQAALTTEFYKGFLVAVDSLKSTDRPLHIYAYDTAGSLDTVKMLLHRPELLTADIIIAPGKEDQFNAIARFGEQNGIMVLNPFLVRSTLHNTNSSVMQANIPSADMLERAVSTVAHRYGNRTPVILRRSGGAEEHGDFVDAVKTAYLDAGASPVIITYNGSLTAANLKRLDSVDGDLIFIPYEGKEDELKKILPALTDYAEACIDSPSRVMLMGYPEWVAFSAETHDMMGRANTVVYSRYFHDPESLDFKNAAAQFAAWYGPTPENVFPCQAFLGIDMGMYIIKALRANGGDFARPTPHYHGIQSNYRFVNTPGIKGWKNEALYLINYRPTGIIDRIDL